MCEIYRLNSITPRWFNPIFINSKYYFNDVDKLNYSKTIFTCSVSLISERPLLNNYENLNFACKL